MQTTAELTGRQREIWNFLVEYVDRHGYPPTVREIGEAVGLASPSTVHAHLANLERAGLLRRDPTKPRALELVGREKSAQTRRGRAAEAAAARGDRRRRPAARGPERRGRDRGAREPRRRLPASRQGRLDDRGRHPRGRRRRRAARTGRARRRDRRRSRGRRRVGRRGDGEAVLPGERPHPAAARERGARADLRAYVQVLGKVVGVFRTL